jgi:hypothetical protein
MLSSEITNTQSANSVQEASEKTKKHGLFIKEQ